VNRQVLAASATAAGALVLVGAFAGGYAIAHDHVVTRVITKTVTPPPVTRTRVRVVIRRAKPPTATRTAAASPVPSATIAGSTISFPCKVEQTGGGGEVYEVITDSGAAYSGTVEVSFYGPTGSGEIFPPVSLPGTAPAGSAANWHTVPPADIGASAEPSGCIAQAAG
jgi:hypothetical protein